jgi:amino acid transporter
VTGITGPVLGGLGGAAIPNFVFWTLTGWLLCLFIAELAAMLPDRTGGAPAYAYYAFKDRLPRTYPHINGLTNWMYWIGWMPVMAVNMLLTGAYLPVLLGFTDKTHAIQIFSNSIPVSYFTLIVGAALSLLLFIPAFLGIRVGTGFATVLGLLSMIPLTILAVAPFFTGDFHGSNLDSFHFAGTGSFFGGHAFFIYLQYSALLTWNVIAMEAAGCYIGECKNPETDAPRAMNLEGGYGVFIYTVLPLAVLGVLGTTFIANKVADTSATGGINGILARYTAQTLNFAGADKIVLGALLIALLLSSLNAIMGCARSLYMMSLDGQSPRIFGHVNRHNVPDFSMGLNVVLNIGLLFAGTPGAIYVLSNVGYVGSFVPVLLGYYFLRRWRPEIHRPYRLPEFMKYVAIGLAALYFFVWAVGIPACAIKGCQLGGGKMFIIGVILVLVYFPLYWWRQAENRKHGTTEYKIPVSA